MHSTPPDTKPTEEESSGEINGHQRWPLLSYLCNVINGWTSTWVESERVLSDVMTVFQSESVYTIHLHYNAKLSTMFLFYFINLHVWIWKPPLTYFQYCPGSELHAPGFPLPIPRKSGVMWWCRGTKLIFLFEVTACRFSTNSFIKYYEIWRIQILQWTSKWVFRKWIVNQGKCCPICYTEKQGNPFSRTIRGSFKTFYYTPNVR